MCGPRCSLIVRRLLMASKQQTKKATALEVPRKEQMFLATAESVKGLTAIYDEGGAAVDDEINRKYGHCNEINTLLKAILKELVWARLERRMHG